MEGLRKEPTRIATRVADRNAPSIPVYMQVVIGVIIFVSGFVLGGMNLLTLTTVNNEANSSLPEDLDYSTVEDVYDALRYQFDGELNEAELLAGLKRGLAEASGDTYTTYFDAVESKEFYDTLNGSFEGIGAELGKNDDNFLIVVSPIKGFPAEEAGLRPQDIISKIDGNDSLHISVEEAVSKIRGEKGTDVTLTIIRDGREQEITITRGVIVLPSVEYEMLENNIGYIQIYRFAEDTEKLARDAAESLLAEGAESVVLDLRNNSGGYVDASVAVSSLWAQNEVVFEQRTGDRVTRSERADDDPVLHNTKTIVLINEGSASASEIVAGALKDLGYAKLVGEQSYGKGSVQSLEEFPDGSTLKVTIARWYTPNGVNIDEEGITPDVRVEFTEADYKNDRDPQLERAIKILSKD